MKTLIHLLASAALVLSFHASAATIHFDDTAEILSGDHWRYTLDDLVINISSTGGSISYSNYFEGLGVSGLFPSLNLSESLSISFSAPVTVTKLYFKSWQDPQLFSTIIVDQVLFSGGGQAITLTNSGQTLLEMLNPSTLIAFDLGEITLDSFTVTPNSLLTGVYLWGIETAEIPLPAAAWLFGSGLLGLVFARRRYGFA